jgi:hypothetical protein
MAQDSTVDTENEKPADSSDEGREYSEGTAMIQKMERGFTRAAYRMANGVAEGIRVYYDEGEKSAASKQDGAPRDILTNAAHGFSAALTEMGKAPLEIAKATDTEAAWDVAQSVSKSVDKAFRRDKKSDKEGANDADDK